MPTLHISTHPLLQALLTELRNKHTPPPIFRTIIARAGLILGLEALANIPTEPIAVETPLCSSHGLKLAQSLVIVPILRAGLAFIHDLIPFWPSAQIGHIGLVRHETTKRPERYLLQLPKHENQMYLLADPMLATGHSAALAVTHLKQHGATVIKFMTLIAAPEGVETFTRQHQDVEIITAALDEKLDKNAYIIPGLGDAGDRSFGT